LTTEVPEVLEDTWTLAGDVSATLLFDIANRAKDAADESLDALRTHNGMTLEQFMDSQR
jgi:hypothetical protein